jgi:hypothetical protein
MRSDLKGGLFFSSDIHHDLDQLQDQCEECDQKHSKLKQILKFVM